MPLRPATLFVIATLLAFSSLPANLGWADEEPSAERELAAKLRGKATNIQFNKDGTVRLIRFSKPLVTDETLKSLQDFPKIDYLAVVCPHSRRI